MLSPQTPKRGGTVVVGIGGEPSCVNPVEAKCGDPRAYLEEVLEPAFAVASDATLRPQLVSGATYTKTPPFTVTFRIHPLLGELDPRYPVSNNAVLWNTHRYYRPNWDGYGYRPALAGRLLEQAGCRRGADRIYVCAGERLSLRLGGISGVPFRERTVELIQRYLQQVGVEVVVSFASLASLVTLFKEGALDMVEFAWFGSYGIGTDVYGCSSAANYTDYCQRPVTADLDQADRILDEEQRARVLNRVDRRLAKDVPVIPLYQPPANAIAPRSHRGNTKEKVP